MGVSIDVPVKILFKVTDMVREMIFRDELHMQQCLAAMNSDPGQLVKDDEENFTASHLLQVILVGDRIEG